MQDDFDQIKLAFLRAQQIKAGLDAGFIREEDYVQARDSFLHALDFSTSASPNGIAPPQRTSTPPLQGGVAGAGVPPPRSTSGGMLRASMPASPKVAPPPPLSPAPAQAGSSSTPGKFYNFPCLGHRYTVAWFFHISHSRLPRTGSGKMGAHASISQEQKMGCTRNLVDQYMLQIAGHF